MLLWLILVGYVLWTLCFWYKRRNLYRLAAKIPDVEGALPIIGHGHRVSGSSELAMSALRKFSYASMKNDGIVTVWFGFILQFVVVDPVDMEFILKTCLEKHELIRFITEASGNGSVFAPVSIWKPRRKLTATAMKPKVVDSFLNIFVEQSQKLVKNLARCGTGEKIDLWPFLSSYSLDSGLETSLGFKLNAQDNQGHPFLTAINQSLNLICERIFHIWLQPSWLYRWFSRSKVLQESIVFMHQFLDKLIENLRQDNINNNNEKASKMQDNQEDDSSFCERKSIIDILIELSGGENGLTNLELREETGVLILAATDTSATGIAFTLLLLAKYPEIQAKLHEELCEVFGDSDRPLEKADFAKLTYLDQVLKESLRILPPVPFVIRKIVKDTKLPSGRVLPAGSGAVCSIWGSHRDPKYWGPDAEHFNPDRFLPGRLNIKHPCSFMPFSNGPRNCVGYRYAMISMKTVLSSILREFKVVPDRENGPIPKIRVKFDIMMKAVKGYPIALEKRDKVSRQRS